MEKYEYYLIYWEYEYYLIYRVYAKNYVHGFYFALFCCVCILSCFNLYQSGLLHWHWGNHMIAPVPVKQPWRIWVNKSQQSASLKWKCHHFDEILVIGCTENCQLSVQPMKNISSKWHFHFSVRALIRRQQNKAPQDHVHILRDILRLRKLYISQAIH